MRITGKDCSLRITLADGTSINTPMTRLPGKGTLADVRAICRSNGAQRVRIREFVGAFEVFPLGKRGRPAHPLTVQRCRKALAETALVGIKMDVRYSDKYPIAPQKTFGGWSCTFSSVP